MFNEALRNPCPGFHEWEFLPENARMRYTVSPEARREILRLLLELNHKLHAEEVAAGIVDEEGKVLKKKTLVETRRRGEEGKKNSGQGEMF